MEALVIAFLKGPAKTLTVIRGRVVDVILALGMSPIKSVLFLRNVLKAQRCTPMSLRPACSTKFQDSETLSGKPKRPQVK